MNARTENQLPEVDDERIAVMERAVFARIGDERAARSRRRRRWGLGASAAAVVIVAAAIVAPPVAGMLTTAGSPSADSIETAPAPDGPALDSSARSTEGSAGASTLQDTTRETISTGSATLVVDDVAAAATAITRAAERRGGYVESVSIGAPGTGIPGADTSLPAPPVEDGGWVTVRVPADDLTSMVAALDEYGEVTASTISAQDVTDQAIDLRARIAAAETSVQRLIQLMAQAQSTSDLIAAESALQERQAVLESDRQQLAWLERQVALATLSVQLRPTASPASADPAGFGDGVVAGWNGLVATLNGFVIAVGFLLPWIAVLAVVGAIGWGVVALVRRVRRRRAAREGPDDL